MAIPREQSNRAAPVAKGPDPGKMKFSVEPRAHADEADAGSQPDWATYDEKTASVAGIEPGADFWPESRFRSKTDSERKGAGRRKLPAMSSHGVARRVQQGSMMVVAVTSLLLAGVLVVPNETRLETSAGPTSTTEALFEVSVEPASPWSGSSHVTERETDDAGDDAGIESTTSDPATTTTTDAAETTSPPEPSVTSTSTPSSTSTSTEVAAVQAAAEATSSTRAPVTSLNSSPPTTAVAQQSTTTRPATTSSRPDSTRPLVPTIASTTSTTQAASTTSTTRAVASTTSTTQAASTTSTTRAASTTSTTRAASTTSTTRAASTTSTTRAASTTAACSGPRWNLVLDEQFNGSSIDTSRWQMYNSAGNAGYGLRRPSAMSVSGGLLTITASMVDGNLVSGGMEHRYDQTYGRYEFRVRTDRDPSETMSGLVMTWPQSDVHPRDGENNVYETLATPGDRHEFYTFIHKPYGSAHQQDYTVHSVDASSWHTMAMEWTPEWIKLYRDGSLVKTINETSSNLIPDVAHHATIQLDAWDRTLPANVRMQVDYIRVYSHQGC